MYICMRCVYYTCALYLLRNTSSSQLEEFCETNVREKEAIYDVHVVRIYIQSLPTRIYYYMLYNTYFIHLHGTTHQTITAADLNLSRTTALVQYINLLHTSLQVMYYYYNYFTSLGYVIHIVHATGECIRSA